MKFKSLSFILQLSTFNLYPSTFNLYPSTFNLQPLSFTLSPRAIAPLKITPSQMDNSANITWCYQVLELTDFATEQEIKTAYRKLARKYHPDLNRGDRNAEARFKQITLAYHTLLTARKQIPQTTQTKQYSTPTQPATSTPNASPDATASGRVRFHVKQRQQSKTRQSTLSPEDRLHKVSTSNKIYSLLKRKKWQQAIEVAENLALQFPGDLEVCQWLAIAYHSWARKLIERQHYEPARSYLKKALQADPHNKQLWLAIDQDYKNMERQLRL